MPLKPDTTALVVLVPAADPLVDPWRQRFDPSRPQGVPAHITLLYPFVTPAEVDRALLDRLGELFAAAAPFDFVLLPPARRGQLSYLPPSPEAPFVALTERIVGLWPQHPPYRGKYGPTIHPHLSIGYSDDGLCPDLNDHAALVADLAGRLPLSTRAEEVGLLARRDDRWEQGPRFALGRRPTADPAGGEGSNESVPGHRGTE